MTTAVVSRSVQQFGDFLLLYWPGDYFCCAVHILVKTFPVCVVADFFVTGVYGRIAKRKVIWVIVPPLAYAVFAGIGYILGWDFGPGIRYPYFFLNWGSPAGAFGFSKELPFMGCVWWILALLVLLLLCGTLYLWIQELCRKRMLRRAGKEKDRG